VLIESMRREGFELSISRPRVVYPDRPGDRRAPRADRGRPVIDVDDEYTGVVIEKLSARKAELKDMGPSGAGKTRIQLLAPSRSLIGYQGEFLTDTRGSGVLNRVFSHYEPHKGADRPAAQGRADLQLRRRNCGLRPVEPRGSRHDVRRRRREDL
jgi:GTP-binding protein